MSDRHFDELAARFAENLRRRQGRDPLAVLQADLRLVAPDHGGAARVEQLEVNHQYGFLVGPHQRCVPHMP
ncbi:hypothetical protein SSTU70S_01850 [Stutzerimonas stutzeri]